MNTMQSDLSYAEIQDAWPLLLPSERSRAALSSTLRYSNQNSGGGSEHPYNMAWGDDDGKTLYLTAQTSLYRIRLNISGVRPKLAVSK
jgi:hypothetical protein